MANVHIKSEERREHEAYVMESFGKGSGATSEDREAAEVIAARSREAYNTMKKMEGKKNA
ncbi:hypothetical protein FACS1894111_05580 [Clostridia bacterium]|nr:hypothetical protein FACS1894111_05580 [Clostridia bacterium]